MAARAMWKGIIRVDKLAVPVKLYSAVQDRSVHFRMLHATDNEPVKQMMVNPETDEVVAHDETLRAHRTDEGAYVLLTSDEIDQLKPKPSRDIDVIKFIPLQAIDHHWYDRPYYLGPDGDENRYAALAEALASSGRIGLVQWVMRNKEYFGALLLYEGYPMLMSLRYADQVVSAESLQPPAGKALDKRELGMARQLIGMLESEFKPQDYRDEYRERVLELIEKKRYGGKVKRPAARKKKAPDDITRALEASLRQVKHA